MNTQSVLRSILLAAVIVLAGCEDPYDYWEDGDSDTASPGNGETAEPDDGDPQSVTGEWRDGRDVAALNAENNEVQWETRNIQAPTTVNLPGDCEWIIARIEGSGYRRLLIMTMHTSGGVRDPARIFLDAPGGGMSDGRFPVPLPGPSHWRVAYRDGALRIWLDGTEIWSARGNYGVDRAVMTDSGRRGFLGEWREVQ